MFDHLPFKTHRVVTGEQLFLAEFWDEPIREWCANNCEGAWETSLESVESLHSVMIAIHFEEEDDALLFQLSY